MVLLMILDTTLSYKHGKNVYTKSVSLKGMESHRRVHETQYLVRESAFIFFTMTKEKEKEKREVGNVKGGVM